MKLFATLETSRGKVVSVSDNEQIVATVYDGNLKAFSVIIEWCNVGDPEHLQCTNCDWTGNEEELDVSEGIGLCPNCGLNSESKLETIPAVMGAIVTTREWRNQENKKRQKCKHYDYLPYKEEDLLEDCKYCKENNKRKIQRTA